VILALFLLGEPSEGDLAFEFGEHLLSLGNYEEAVTEYKRFIFLNPDDERRSLAHYRIWQAYRTEHRWGDAIEHLRSSIALTNDAEMKAQRRVDLALTLFAIRELNLAKLELMKAGDDKMPRETKVRSTFLLGVVSLYDYNWDEAQVNLQTALLDLGTDSTKISELNRLFAQTRRRQKSPRFASILSAFLPGAGQIYAGDWKSGINALALNGVLIFWTVKNIKDKDYQDAFLISSFLLPRYYIGNIRRAGEIAKRVNLEMNWLCALRIIETLSSEFGVK
jgi:hypothetical protein